MTKRVLKCEVLLAILCLFFIHVIQCDAKVLKCLNSALLEQIRNIFSQRQYIS